MFLEIKENVRKLLESASKEQVSSGDITESHVADLSSMIAFRIAKNRKQSPGIVAEEIVKKIKPLGFIREARAENGYINFFLDYRKLVVPFLKAVKSAGENYGRLKSKGEKIVLEHSSINPSGPIHIGRLRNSLIGDSLAKILKFNGYDVETHYFVNDIGKQIAIIAQGFKKGVESEKTVIEKYRRYEGKDDFKIFFMYVAANKIFESEPSFAEEVQGLIQLAESGDRDALDTITGVAKKCLGGQREIFKALGIEFDSFDFESSYIRENGVKDVLDLLGKSRYAKTTDKGLGLDLSEFGLERRSGFSTLTRSDGTSVYLARDIAYHLDKSGWGDRMINVLGEDHKFEFQELKAILTKIYGLKIPLDVVHYSFVSFEGEELSTRKGLTAPVDSLIDSAVEKAGKEIAKRKIAGKETAPAIGIGAIKYHILKTSPLKPITFRWEEALNFEGEASPYIQYAHARCCSILRKSEDLGGIKIESIDKNLENDEKKLLLKILKFHEIVEKAGMELKPNLVANYLYELTSMFSKFYKECPVLSAEKTVMDRRLLLVDATRQVVRNGLYLLGIEAPERM
jgi:arginyl-tRNA synthetase